MYIMFNENYSAGEKWKYLVPIAETWLYLSDFNRKRMNLQPKNEKSTKMLI